jgi:hypothetical protein
MALNAAVQSLDNIQFADQFAGSDVGAKINAAVLALGSNAGEIWVSQLAGTIISTTVVLNANQIVRFVQGGTWVITANPGFNLSANNSGVIGSGPGFAAVTGQGTTLQAGANNVVLIKGTNTYNGATGSLTTGVVVQNLVLNGNYSTYTGTVAINFTALANSLVDNVGIINTGLDSFTCACFIDSIIRNVQIGSSQGNGLHVLDNGIGAGSGNLRVDTLVIAFCKGDALILEGAGAGQYFTNLNMQENTGTGIRVRAQSSDGYAPNGFTFDTVTLEANGDSTAQLNIAGSSAANGLVIGGKFNEIVINGQMEVGGPTPAPTAINVNYDRNISFTNTLSFGGTNTFNFTSNTFGCEVLNPRSSDTNFFLSGSVYPVIYKHATDTLTVGNLFPYDSIIGDSNSSNVWGMRGGPSPEAGRILLSDASYAGSINAVSNSGGVSAALNSNASAAFRIVKTSDGVNFTQILVVNNSGVVSLYNGINTAGNGMAAIYGVADLTGKTSNQSGTLLTPSASGLYRVSVHTAVTTAASTSSTLPSLTIGWTDPDSGVSQTLQVTPTSAGNTTKTLEQAIIVINAKASDAITFSNSGYASSGSTAMQFSLHMRIEAL